MRYRDLVEAKPLKPLTPEQGRRRAERIAKAQSKLADTQTAALIKINQARRDLSEI